MVVNNKDEFNTLIKEGYVFIDFFANWCINCKAISPIIDELEKEYTNIKFLKIDIDALEDISLGYGIMSVPTFILLKDGKMIKKKSGLSKKSEIKELLDSNT